MGFTDHLLLYSARPGLVSAGPTEQGIFRVPGEGEMIKKLKDAVNKGSFVVFLLNVGAFRLFCVYTAGFRV